MLIFNGYVPLRRGLLQHLQEKRITRTEFDVFIILLLWADHRTGIATTNGTGLVFLSGGQLDLRWTQVCLASLETKGYIKRPFFMQGQRGDQKIFIDKFVITDGPLKGRVLSFADTTDWESPAYVEIREDNSEDNAEDNAANNASNNNRLLNNVKTKIKKPSGESREQGEKGQKQNQLGLEIDQFSGKAKQQPVDPPAAASVAPQGKTPRLPALAGGRDPMDRYVIEEKFLPLLYEFSSTPEEDAKDIRGGTRLGPPGWDSMDRVRQGELEYLFAKTADSADTMLEVTRWALEKSNYWFAKGDGTIRTFTDWCNAYPSMSKQYRNYMAKVPAKPAPATTPEPPPAEVDLSNPDKLHARWVTVHGIRTCSDCNVDFWENRANPRICTKADGATTGS